MSGSLTPIDQNRPADLTQAVHFGHNRPEASPATPGFVRSDVAFVRKVFNDKLVFADGNEVEYWSFKDPQDDKPFPATPIRVRQGQVVHTTLEPAINVHTIHHHGIEPSTFNDGVPDTSFTVNSHYTYQWRASRAGTFFYHCHRNAPLHVQMGMFGFLVIDPPTGPGQLYVGGPTYDVEAMWGTYDVDPFWRTYNHASGEKNAIAEGTRLNRFRPRYFTVNGVDAPQSLRSPKTTVRARVGQRVLLRHVTGAYFINVVRFPAALAAVLHMTDGEPLPVPTPVPGNVLTTTTAERFDLILTPQSVGTHTITYEFRNWLTNDLAGIATAHVLVS
ncbi:multicopper oxidase domain-containing protein [Terrabacter sp. BE26]|uniref:multicopper oxidase domain-containing protein n=1 Tax=Terrabacter sp. BE26 TaxID=2898152 RepID=UPI0035BE4204